MNILNNIKIIKWVGLIISTLLLATSFNVLAKSKRNNKHGSSWLVAASSKSKSESNDQKKLLDKLEKTLNKMDSTIEGVAATSPSMPVIKGYDPTRPEMPAKVIVVSKEDEEKANKERKFLEEQLPPALLTAIFVKGKNKVAIINGKVAKEGEEVEGKKIVKIFTDRVKIKELGEIKILTLPGTKIITEEK